ncbi:MAG: Lrp/AsnC family transcriptional regulator [Akkermansia sp.]
MSSNTPVSSADPINRQILSFAEDQITGFHATPFASIAQRAGLDEQLVIQRLAAMLQAGTIRRIRQTLLSTSLADGALIAWELPDEQLEAAYAWLKDNDPFTGHVVLRRSEDPAAAGARYRLWTTLKVPTGYGSVVEHCKILSKHIGALDFVPLPVVGMFALSVGHVRRAGMQVGDKLPEPAKMQVPVIPTLSQREWDVLLSLKESLLTSELTTRPWGARAAALGMSDEEFCRMAKALDEKKVIGRFASFLDHQGRGGHDAGTRASGLFHWTVPEGMEERAGAECGRHICMTHCYWRSGGEKLGGAQIMGVVHAKSRELVLAHKRAIDEHLASVGIPILHSAVFWSERAEVRPSEIRPDIYEAWLAAYA